MAYAFAVMSKALASILALVAVGGAALFFVEFSARLHAEAMLAARSRVLDSLVNALGEARADAKKSADELAIERENVARLKKERDAALEKSKQVADAGTPGAQAPDAKPPVDLRGMLGGFAKAFDDPDQRKAMKGMQEQMVSGAYAKLFKDLGLSEADSKLVSELLGERNFLAMDKGRKLLGGKTDDDSVAALRKDIETTKTDYDAKVKAVLGEEKSAKLSAYEQTVGDRRSLDFMARDFERKGYALDEPQKDRLTKIMTEERLKNPSNEIPDLGGGPGVAVLMSDAELKTRKEQEQAYQQRVVSRAAEAGLNPDQVTILQDSFKQQSEMREFSTRMGRSFLRPPQ